MVFHDTVFLDVAGIVDRRRQLSVKRTILTTSAAVRVASAEVEQAAGAETSYERTWQLPSAHSHVASAPS